MERTRDSHSFNLFHVYEPLDLSFYFAAMPFCLSVCFVFLLDLMRLGFNFSWGVVGGISFNH